MIACALFDEGLDATAIPRETDPYARVAPVSCTGAETLLQRRRGRRDLLSAIDDFLAGLPKTTPTSIPVPRPPYEDADAAQFERWILLPRAAAREDDRRPNLRYRVTAASALTGLTFDEIAAVSDVSRSTLFNWLGDQTTPRSSARRHALERFLNVIETAQGFLGTARTRGWLAQGSPCPAALLARGRIDDVAGALDRLMRTPPAIDLRRRMADDEPERTAIPPAPSLDDVSYLDE